MSLHCVECAEVTRLTISYIPVTLTHLLVIRCGLIELPHTINCLINLQVLDVTGNQLVSNINNIIT